MEIFPRPSPIILVGWNEPNSYRVFLFTVTARLCAKWTMTGTESTSASLHDDDGPVEKEVEEEEEDEEKAIGLFLYYTT